MIIFFYESCSNLAFCYKMKNFKKNIEKGLNLNLLIEQTLSNMSMFLKSNSISTFGVTSKKRNLKYVIF